MRELERERERALCGFAMAGWRASCGGETASSVGRQREEGGQELRRAQIGWMDVFRPLGWELVDDTWVMRLQLVGFS